MTHAWIPRFYSMNPDTTATAKPEVINLRDFSALIGECQAPKQIQFSLGEKVFSLRIRALSSVEMAAANQITSILPPRALQDRQNPATGRTEKILDHDYSDPEFIARVARADRTRRAFVLEKGLVDLAPEGATQEERTDFFEKNFPAQILSSIARQIESISDGELKILDAANFFFADDSFAAQS